MKYIYFILILFTQLVNGQTKRGGIFLRGDDFFLVGEHYTLDADRAAADTFFEQASRQSLTTTWSLVNEYYRGIQDLNYAPHQSFWEEKLNYIKQLVDSGHNYCTHTVNHSTSFFVCHVDSCGTTLQNYIDNGYSYSDGIDTIIINNTATPAVIWHYRHVQDNRFAFFGSLRITDTDSDWDSIYYPAIMPPYSVYFATTPNSKGLELIINEAKRRFTNSGLAVPDCFVHPGQEYTLDNYYHLDSIKENSGYVETTTGNDTVIYHIQNLYSSCKIPLVTYSKLQIGNTRYVIAYQTGTYPDYTLKLTSYSGDGSEHTAIQRPANNCHWMFNVDQYTIDTVADDMNLKECAIYPMGRQYDPLGYNASAVNKPYFRRAHQWGHMLLSTETGVTGIKDICEASARHYLIGTNDHTLFYGGAKFDTVFNFVNQHLDDILVIPYSDLQDSLYDKTLDPYENIMPSFDMDLNADDIQDGYTIGAQTWERDSLTDAIDGDTTFMIITNDATLLYVSNLWGIEKGDNIFSMWIRSTSTDSVLVSIMEYKHTNETARGYSNYRTTNYYIKNLTSNFARRFIKTNILTTTDWIKVTFSVNDDNTADIIKPEMMLYSTERTY